MSDIAGTAGKHTDLVAVVALVVAFGLLVVALPGRVAGLQLALGLPFLLAAPGYAVLAAVYPDSAPDLAPTERGTGLLTPVERIALSVVTSIGVVALVALVANATPWGVRPVPVAIGVGAVTVGAAALAARRRGETAGNAGPGLPSRGRVVDAISPGSGLTAVLNVLLVASLVTAATVVVATPDPGGDEEFTELAMLGESAGDRSVAALPTAFTVGEPRPVYLRVSNHEGEPTEYAAVVLLETVESGQVTGATELDRTAFSVGTDETRTVEQPVTPTRSGERLRLTVLLYRGEAPDSPSRETAYRALHLWVSVSDRE